jgi:hypothetical protein
MSSVGSHDPAASRDRGESTGAGLIICAAILVLFVLASVIGAQRKDVTQGFDEIAHASYVAHIQHTGALWPPLEAMRMLDPQRFRFTGEMNYLNHPSAFYALHAVLGPTLEGDKGALFAHRLIDILIVTAGLAAVLAIGLAAKLPRHELYAYAVPLACIPVLAQLAGAVNNDNLAFAGGALTTLAAWQLLATGRRAWLAAALAGVIVAAWAKLTGLMLAGGMVTTVIAYLIWRGRLSWRSVLPVAAAFAIAAAPYLVFIAQYGSPTPNTPAQIALLQDGARLTGWADAERKSFFGYAGFFIGAFVVDWMPTLAPRSILHLAMLAIPIASVGCAATGIAFAVRRLMRRQEQPLDVVVIAGALALAATFAVHVSYSYGRHLATGWMMDAYPRYYLPLAAIVPLAGLALLAAVERPRWRTALLGFLIAGPVVFRLLGDPLK